MRVFISYAKEQREIAERLALGLRNSGDEVFFDRDDIPPGNSFDDRIRRAIQRSHLFIFLISSDSLHSGAYALTELGVAEQRWSRPSGKVLPVLVENIPIDKLPPYLRSVSVLEPHGDLVADALASIARLHDIRRRALLARLAIGGLALLLVCGALLLMLNPTLLNAGPSIGDVHVTSLTGGGLGDPSKGYRFVAVLDNSGNDQLRTIGLGVDTDDARVAFGSSSEWFLVERGQKKPVSIDASRDGDAKISTFKWRVCWTYVREADWQESDADRKRGAAFEIFMDRYGRQVCNTWSSWPLGAGATG